MATSSDRDYGEADQKQVSDRRPAVESEKLFDEMCLEYPRDSSSADGGGINMLLLGESGVGKSTWINAFANYCEYESLHEAEKSQGSFPIECTCTTSDQQTGETVKFSSTGYKILTAERKDGESVTQNPGELVFSFGNTRCTLIDTPGLLDTADIGQSRHDKDNAHVNNILKLLSSYEEIHAICILIKASETRLSESFQYVLKQIFTHLDKDACKNVVFVFTFAESARSTFGNTLSVLKRFVKESRLPIPLQNDDDPVQTRTPSGIKSVFRFENGVVDYLLQRNYGSEFDEDDTDEAERSWKKSVKELERMFQYVRSLKPYSPANLNYICKIQMMLGLVVESLTCIIQDKQNRVQAKQKCDEAAQNTQFPAVVQKMLATEVATLFTKTEIETTPLDHIDVVCQSWKCSKVHNNKVVFPQICCPHCSHKWMWRCKQMTWFTQTCRVCGCSKYDHKWTTTKTKINVKNSSIDKEISEISDKTSAKKLIEKYVKECDESICKYDTEISKMIEKSAKLNTYVCETLALASSDDDELPRLLRNRRESFANSKEDTSVLVKAIEDIEEQYQKRLTSEDNACSSSDVPALLDQLCRLPLAGTDLSSGMDANEKAVKEYVAKTESKMAKVSKVSRITSAISSIIRHVPQSVISGLK